MRLKISWIAVMLMCVTVGLLTSLTATSAQQPDDKTSWWNQEKIRFFWGQWDHFWQSGMSPEQLMEDLSRLGATVFTGASRQRESIGEYIWSCQDEFLGQGDIDEDCGSAVFFDLELARIARQYGIHYFGWAWTHTAPTYARSLKKTKKLRWARDQTGKSLALACPMDQSFYESWIFAPTIKAVRTGLVDGLHFDWEKYGGRSEAGVCYCDVCFHTFLKSRGTRTEVHKSERYAWLQGRDLEDEYVEVHEQRRKKFWGDFARRVHKIKPDFVFSGYGAVDCPASYYYGLHSPQAPFIVIDESHYWPNHTAPWWETRYAEYGKLGMKHILGSYSGGMFGELPIMDVSATQWIYDAAISHDGYWIWFEHLWGPNDYRVYRTAEQRIRATESKVGDFLFSGERDHKFVCLVEQSGDPVLGQNVIQRSFHLGDRHLVQMNNVNTDIPVEVLVRVGRLPSAQWTVKDAMTGLYYVPDRKKSLWSSRDLGQGILLSMEKRSEKWLVMSPAVANLKIDPDKTVDAGTIMGHPKRTPTKGPLPTGASPVAGSFPLLYLKSDLLGSLSAGPTNPNPVTGTSIHHIDAASGSDAKQLFAIKGNCWSPILSPDRTKIVFSSYVNGKGQIYTMNSDGSNPYNISKNDFCDKTPVWSSDGKRIAFVSDRDVDWEVYVMNVDGTDQRRLTDSPGVDCRPAWSPDGNRIAFESDRGGEFDIYVINADGSDERCLSDRAGNEYEPIWSPDGRNVAYTMASKERRDVVVADAQTGSSMVPLGLTRGPKPRSHFRELHSICFSPDGKRIAGVWGYSVPRHQTTGIFIVGVDGTGLRRLVIKQPLKPYPGGPATSKAARHYLMGGWYYNGSSSRRWLPKTFDNVSWSPDGSTLAFSSDMDASGYFFFYTIGADGNNLTRLDATLHPAGPHNKASDSGSLDPEGEKLFGFATTPSAKAHYIDGTSYRSLVPKLRLATSLPLEGWSFKADSAGIGLEKGYFKPDYSTESFSRIRIGDFWDNQGHKRLREGWYRLRYTCPELAEGKRVFLDFGAVDESAWLYVDGKLIAWYDTADPGMTWDKPFLLEVTGSIKGQGEHLLVIRVSNTINAGGIWKPVRLMVEP